MERHLKCFLNVLLIQSAKCLQVCEDEHWKSKAVISETYVLVEHFKVKCALLQLFPPDVNAARPLVKLKATSIIHIDPRCLSLHLKSAV